MGWFESYFDAFDPNSSWRPHGRWNDESLLVLLGCGLESFRVNGFFTALARWSNDLIRSTKHRVVEPPLPSSPHPSSNPSSTPSHSESEAEGHPPRYSIAYFCNPNYEVWIDALPGTWENVEGGKKYEGIGAKEYLFSRLEATVGEK